MPTKDSERDAPGTEFYTTALTCGTCGGDLNKSWQWLRCRAHFTRRIAELENRATAIAYIQRLLFWDSENERWDDDMARNWNGFDELADFNSLLADLNLVPKEGDPPPPEFPR